MRGARNREQRGEASLRIRVQEKWEVWKAAAGERRSERIWQVSAGLAGQEAVRANMASASGPSRARGGPSEYGKRQRA